jgi:MraZ protein
MDEWNLLMEKMNKKNRFRKKNNDFIRRFSAGVKPLEIDGTGRLLIPKNLVSIAGISKEVVLSSAINIIEIWDKESYEKVIDETAENFAELAEEVMGDDGDELS